MASRPAWTLARAPDGTPLFAPRGELVADAEGEHVQCHLCGDWYRQLGSTHLPRAHGVTGAEYRVLVGLRPRHPLWAPVLVTEHADRFRARLADDERLQRGVQAGRALAAAGDLQRRARELAAERPSSLERERQLARSGAALGSGRARRYAEARAARAREHGYAGLEDYYRERYLRDRAKLDQLAAELGCHESAVRGDLKRLGLGPDRTRSHGARWKTR